MIDWIMDECMKLTKEIGEFFIFFSIAIIIFILLPIILPVGGIGLLVRKIKNKEDGKWKGIAKGLGGKQIEIKQLALDNVKMKTKIARQAALLKQWVDEEDPVCECKLCEETQRELKRTW